MIFQKIGEIMLKICQSCHQENKSNYNNFCQKCYNKKWAKKLGIRTCSSCSKDYKGFGKNCSACARILRESRSPTLPCSKCHRTSAKIKSKEFQLCGRCLRQKKEIDDPSYRQKRIIYNRRMHRIYRNQDPDGPLRHAPSGSGYLNKYGYKVITKVGHANQLSPKGAILEHTFIMSEHLGRPIRKNESVHHKNGIRNDNRIENLELWHRSQPPGQRLEDKIEWSKKLLEEYGYLVELKDYNNS